MNIYEYAMQMEKDGERYYRELAENAGNEGLRNILNMLAEEEVKHFHVLQHMRNNDAQVEYAETDLLADAKNVFIAMREEQGTVLPSQEQAALYRSVQETESKSYKFYLEKSETAESEAERELLLRIAEEERRHMVLMGSIADFVSRPETWIEDAEFNHLDEY